MKNVQLFNEFTLRILHKLYESFPAPIKLEESQFIEEVIDYPSPPFHEYFGIPGAGIYVGPITTPSLFFDKEQKIESRDEFDWTGCLMKVESILGRKLDENEKNCLLTRGVRPYTQDEEQALARWKDEVTIYKENDTQRQRKKNIFIATTQFLVKEGYIRFLDLPEHADKQMQRSDILIERTIDTLRFTLTNRGFVQLNQRFQSGRLSSDASIFERIRSYLTDKSVDAFTGAGAGAIVSTFLGG